MQTRYSSALILGMMAVIAGLPAVAQADVDDAKRERVATPPQFHGPFYPTALPRDTDNDLVIINETGTMAAGEIVHLSGQVVDINGEPVANALIELWQTDSSGVYLHHDSPHRSEYDRNFQGFGRVLTGPSGEYYFRTIKPASHVEKRSRRAAHFHIGVFVEDRSPLFTQVYFENQMFNDRDPILNSVSTTEQRQLLIVPLEIDPKSDELTARFDVVMRFQQDN